MKIDRQFKVFELKLLISAICTLLVVSVIHYFVFGVCLLIPPFCFVSLPFFVGTYLIGGFLAWFSARYLRIKRLFTVWVWIMINVLFATLMILINFGDSCTEAWAILFVVGHAMFSFIPINVVAYQFFDQ
ncbi:hypothetical protein LJC12_03125 [Odoribacter sp. OttesenSCG-928-J03]|nr:hypothetical protein [Odoribacter sp. OttesenSCG-928-J03]